MTTTKQRGHIWSPGHSDFRKEIINKFETQLLDFDNLARYV